MRYQHRTHPRHGNSGAHLPPAVHQPPKGPVAFVLSGGASAAACQIGMLRALQEHGITPDMVVGTSAGAINGAMLAGRPDDAVDRLTDLWQQLTRSQILHGNSLRHLGLLLRTRRHLCSPAGLYDLIERHKPAHRLEDLALPFGATTTDAHTGESVLLTRGPLTTALVASASIPGVFPRVAYGDRWLIDGGISANVPIRQAVEMGAKSLVILDAAPDIEDSALPNNIAEIVQHVAFLLVRQQAGSDLRSAADLPVLRIPNIARPALSPFDFSQTNELIELGYHHTCDFLSTSDDLNTVASPRPELQLAVS